MFTLRTNKDADPQEVVSTVVAIALSTTHVLEDPQPFVIFQGQLEQSLVFDVYYWQIGEVFITRSELNLGIFKALREKGIEISIPILEIKNINNPPKSN
jgi:small-conductance mechanosensitive channel